jgi:hypothetical protein
MEIEPYFSDLRVGPQKVYSKHFQANLVLVLNSSILYGAQIRLSYFQMQLLLQMNFIIQNIDLIKIHNFHLKQFLSITVHVE